jgi:hypothetical protein
MCTVVCGPRFANGSRHDIRARSAGGTPPEGTADRAAGAARQSANRPNREHTMNAMTKGLLTIALLATAACDGAPTASSDFASPTDGAAFVEAAATLSFSYTQSGSEETPQTATGGAGSISFTGSLSTPTPCYELTAAQSTKRNNITVTVTAAGTGGFCTQVITNNNYQGAVSGLAAGTYSFTVVEVVNGTRTTAYSGPVVVQ